MQQQWGGRLEERGGAGARPRRGSSADLLPISGGFSADFQFSGNIFCVCLFNVNDLSVLTVFLSVSVNYVLMMSFAISSLHFGRVMEGRVAE